MASTIRMTNAAGRDGLVRTVGLKREQGPSLGLPGHSVNFRRYLAATEACRGAALALRLGGDYGQVLLDSDPEVDIEHVGRLIGETSAVYLSQEGELLRVPPALVEVITLADGSEKERREPKDIEANVNEDQPLRWTGRKLPMAEAVRRFAFRRSLQILHSDGVTYEFLYAIASDLARDNVLMLVGGGDKGNEPLVFQANGRPCRGFLQGRVDGERYQLLLHLSDMELKRPAPKE